LSAAQAVIRIDNISMEYERGDEIVHALGGLSLDVYAGEILCIVGSSGCGKSTLLSLIAGFQQPTSGRILLHDTPITGVDTRCGMIFQEYALFPWKTVQRNVEFGLKMRRVPPAERRRAAQHFIKLVGLDGFENAYPAELSGGMRQRAALARSLANDPEILLMDEPFAALDAHNKLILQEELLRIWEGSRKTVLFITHAIDEAIALGDRIVVMTAQPGRIKAIVPVDFPRPRSAAELRGDPRFGALQLSIWRMLEDEVRTARLQAEGERR